MAAWTDTLKNLAAVEARRFEQICVQRRAQQVDEARALRLEREVLEHTVAHLIAWGEVFQAEGLTENTEGVS